MKILPQKEETVLFLDNTCSSTQVEVRSIILRRGVRLDDLKFYSNAQTL